MAMGFLETIRINYGNSAYQDLKLWANTSRQLANYNNHKKFLLQCRQKQVLPIHLTRSIASMQFLLIEDNPFRDKFAGMFREFQFKTINLEISYIHWKIAKLNKILAECKTRVSVLLPSNIFDSFSTSQNNFYKKNLTTIKNKQKRKFNKLFVNQTQPTNNVNNSNTKWFINKTDLEFPRNVENILALGEKFNLPYGEKNLPIEQLIIDTEYIINSNTDENIRTEKRNKVVNIITNFLSYNRVDKGDTKLIRDEAETRIFLKENPEIVILKADKGNSTVAMSKTDFLHKGNELLSDTNTYLLLKKDPTVTIQNKLNKIIDKLIERTSITKDEGKQLKCTNGIFPKLYFQPKIHKDNVPIRPIVSFVGSPAYNLTKYLSKLVNFAFEKDEYYTKNSFEMVSFIQNFQIPQNYILVSLDVKSLFTNIPIDLTTNLLINRWSIIKNHCKLSLDEFVELLEFAFDNNYFNFNNQFYKQIYGLGMGNCLSPSCSDVVMSELQLQCIKKLPFKLPFFKRYVDDIITCVPADQIDTLLTTFNSFHSKLQFTIEQEQNNSIAFLDILLMRTNENKIKTDWYHKPTFSERFLNFNSQHSYKQKMNIIHNLKHRALKLSHPDFHEKNLNNIITYLAKNNYPHKLINRILYKPKITARETQRTNTVHLKLPYIKNLSEKLKKELTNDTVTVAFKNENTVKNLFTKQKTPTPRDLESNVIYKIPCSECEGIYIGQTGRYLKTRISEHRRSVRPITLINTKTKTALAEHFENFEHQFNFDQTSIVDKQNNYKKRLLSEMIQIKKHQNNINKKQDIDNLNASYFNILKYIQHPV